MQETHGAYATCCELVCSAESFAELQGDVEHAVLCADTADCCAWR